MIIYCTIFVETQIPDTVLYLQKPQPPNTTSQPKESMSHTQYPPPSEDFEGIHVDSSIMQMPAVMDVSAFQDLQITVVPPIKLFKSKGGLSGSSSTEQSLEITKKYSEITFTRRLATKGDISEKSGTTKMIKGKKVRRRIILVNLFGRVLIKVPKGQSITTLALSPAHTLDFFNTKQLVILSERRAWWGLWKVTAAELVNFGEVERLSEFIDKVQFEWHQPKPSDEDSSSSF